MATKTEHYRLSLPTAWDGPNAAQIRSDHSVLDAAIHAAQVRSEGAVTKVADLEYNVYNLVLQDYYDGKQTGYKKALVFDGFRDGNGITSLSGGIQRGNGVLTLQGSGQGNIAIGYGSQRKYLATTAAKSITGSGTVTGFQCQLYSGMAITTSSNLSYTLTRNGATVSQGTAETPQFAPQTTQVVTVGFPGGVAVGAGDSIALKLETGGSAWLLTLASDNSTLAGTFLIRSVTGSAGRMTGRTNSLPACSGAHGWVRYRGGKVALSLRDQNNAALSFSLEGTRSTVNLQGASCTEAAFRLDQGLAAGNIAVLLDLDLNGSGSMEVFDYGVVLM